MRLSGNVSILFGDKAVTDQVLKTYRRKWKGYALLPGIDDSRFSDEEAFYALLYESTPLTIVGDESKDPLVFEVSFKKFPYSIKDRRGFAAYGLRLTPKQGCVKSVKFDRDDGPPGVPLSVSADCVSVDCGGDLHLEIFFRPIKHQKGVRPPSDFRKNA